MKNKTIQIIFNMLKCIFFNPLLMILFILIITSTLFFIKHFGFIVLIIPIILMFLFLSYHLLLLYKKVEKLSNFRFALMLVFIIFILTIMIILPDGLFIVISLGLWFIFRIIPSLFKPWKIIIKK
jgi:hypothetical protein